MLTKDLAITLRSVPFQERHKIVTALTENHGVISALAYNAIQSRRFGGALEIFAASEWHFTGKPQSTDAKLFSLKEAATRRSFEGLRGDFEKLSLASCLNELMLKQVPTGPCPELFKLHSNALAVLEEWEEGKGAPFSVLNCYLAKLLKWHGVQPAIESCMECKISLEKMERDEILSCQINPGGWLCPSCQVGNAQNITTQSIPVMPMAILDFQVSLMLPIRQACSVVKGLQEEHRNLFRFLEGLLIYNLPGFEAQPLKGLRFLGLESNVPRREDHPQ